MINGFDDKLKFNLKDHFIVEKGKDDEGTTTYTIGIEKQIKEDGNTDFKFYARVQLSAAFEDINEATEKFIELPGNELAGDIKCKVHFSVTAVQHISATTACAFLLCGNNIYTILAIFSTALSRQKNSNLQEWLVFLNDILSSVIYAGQKGNFENITETMITEDLEAAVAADMAAMPFPIATPQERQHTHWDYLNNTRNTLGLLGNLIQMNQTGTEYAFMAIDADFLGEFHSGKDLANLISTNKEDFPLADVARKMGELFRVNESVFDPAEDREQEIANGLLRRCGMYEAFRSFAWTLAAYCDREKLASNELDMDTLEDMAEYVVNVRENLNYKAESYCPVLCAGDDIHNYYILDAVPANTKQTLIQSLSEREEEGSNYDPQTHVLSLNGLRNDLEYLYPAMQIIYDNLVKARDFDEPLEGAVAEILYAWCAMTYAARTPFYTEDGPVNCHWNHPVSKPELISFGTSSAMADEKAETCVFSFTYDQGLFFENENYVIAIPDGFVIKKNEEGRDFIAYLPNEKDPDDYNMSAFVVMAGNDQNASVNFQMKLPITYCSMYCAFTAILPGSVAWYYEREELPGVIAAVVDNSGLHANAMLAYGETVKMIRFQVETNSKKQSAACEPLIKSMLDRMHAKKPVQMLKQIDDADFVNMKLNVSAVKKWTDLLDQYKEQLIMAHNFHKDSLEEGFHLNNPGLPKIKKAIKELLRYHTEHAARYLKKADGIYQLKRSQFPNDNSLSTMKKAIDKVFLELVSQLINLDGEKIEYESAYFAIYKKHSKAAPRTAISDIFSNGVDDLSLDLIEAMKKYLPKTEKVIARKQQSGQAPEKQSNRTNSKNEKTGKPSEPKQSEACVLTKARFFMDSDVHTWLVDKAENTENLNLALNCDFTFDVIDQAICCCVCTQDNHLDIKLYIRREMGIVENYPDATLSIAVSSEEFEVEKFTESGHIGNANQSIMLFMKAAMMLLMQLSEKGVFDEFSNMDTGKEGVLIRLENDELVFEHVTGQDRPVLSCQMYDGHVKAMRPYEDELAEEFLRAMKDPNFVAALDPNKKPNDDAARIAAEKEKKQQEQIRKNTEEIKNALSQIKSEQSRAEYAFERVKQEIDRLSSSEINIFYDDIESRIRKIVSVALKGGNEFFEKCQELVLQLDRICRPLAIDGVTYDIIRQIANLIEELNDESEIEYNFTASFDEYSLGGISDVNYSPTDEAKSIERYWKTKASQEKTTENNISHVPQTRGQSAAKVSAAKTQKKAASALNAEQAAAKEEEKRRKYEKAKTLFEQAQSPQDIKTVQKAFSGLKGYSDANEYIQKCNQLDSLCTKCAISLAENDGKFSEYFKKLSEVVPNANKYVVYFANQLLEDHQVTAEKSKVLKKLIAFYKGEFNELSEILSFAVSLFMQEELFEEAEYYNNRILKEDSKCAEAWLSMCLIGMRISSIEDVIECDIPLKTCRGFEEYCSLINNKKKKEILALSQKQQERIAEKKQEIYDSAVLLQNQNSVESIERAIEIFSSISDFKDSADQINESQKRIEEIKARIEQRRLKKQNRKKKAKKLFMIFSVLAVIGLVLALITVFLVIPLIRFNQAVSLMEQAKYQDAQAVLGSLEGFGDSENKLVILDAIDSIESGEHDAAIKKVLSASEAITVKYNLNGGNSSAGDYFTYANASDYSSLLVPQKEGYRFVKWDLAEYSYNKELSLQLSLDAVWSDEYIIKYTLDGGTASNPIEYHKDGSAVTLNNPTKEGYTFIGWTGTDLKEPIMSVTILAGSYGDREFIANWEAHGQITYHLNGGTASNISEYTFLDADFTLNNPTREGYTFIGWTGTDLNGLTMSVTIPSGSHGNREFTANWEPHGKITYHLNGGTATNISEYTFLDADFTLNNPTREGYIFSGWTGTDLNGLTMSVTISSGSHGDREFTANWTPIVYTLTLDANSGIVDTSSITAGYQTPYTLPTPTKDYYTFVGWYNGDQKYDNGTWHKAGDVILTAQWQITPYDITYHLDGGINSPQNPLYVTAETSKIPLEPPTREGYRFVGWFLDSAYTENIAEIPAGTHEEIALYAKWEIIHYVITYQLNGGTISETKQKTFTVNDLPLSLLTPSKTDCTFLGWKKDDYYGADITQIKNCENTTVYAMFLDAYLKLELFVPRSSWDGKETYYIVTDYAGTATTVDIPAYYNGYPIREIDGMAFYDCESIRSLNIPTTVREIGAYAFDGCSSLKQIVIPQGVAIIENDTFANCVSLTSVFMPDTVTVIEYNAFENCSALRELQFSSQLKEIQFDAFMGCSSLRSVEIPDTVIKIGEQAFKNCTRLYQLDIPYGVTKIGDETFAYCESLTSITLPNTITEIGYKAFYNCSSLRNVNLPTKLKRIAGFSFSGCSSLRSIEIPSSVTAIQTHAFEGCRSLTNVILQKGLKEIDSWAFYNCAITKLIIPDSVITIWGNAFDGCTSAEFYCRATARPSGWDKQWNEERPVVWGYKGD